MKLMVIFILANCVNVVIQTIKSLITVKCGKGLASIVNALAYGFYTYIVILMSADLPLFSKCVIVGLCNLIGVYVVKYAEEKMRKDKLWKIEAVFDTTDKEKVIQYLENNDLAYSIIPIEYKKKVLFNVYAYTQQESTRTKQIIDMYKGKYFVSEAKNLY